MKLKQIEEIATRQVPIWQPALLVTLLLLGTFVIPLIQKKSSGLVQKSEPIGSTLRVKNIQTQLSKKVNDVVLPLSDNLKKEAEAVLGIAQQTVQQTVQNIASKSASQAKEFVFENTLGKALQNFNTLPIDQQEVIKKAICK